MPLGKNQAAGRGDALEAAAAGGPGCSKAAWASPTAAEETPGGGGGNRAAAAGAAARKRLRRGRLGVMVTITEGSCTAVNCIPASLSPALP